MKKRLHRYAIHVGRVTLHVSRWGLYVSAVVLVLLAIVFTIARFTLPMIAERKPDLEQYLSHRSGRPVHIESLLAYWDGLHPGAKVTGLQVYAADGVKPAIRLSEVRISLALLPLLWGKLEINSLVVVNPSLALERLNDGRFRVSGFDPLRAAESGAGEKFVSWLFQQGRLEIENGDMQWIDHRETDSALHLSGVNLVLENSGDRHRLGVSAKFPPEICRDCSLTLDITGNPLTSSTWDGDISLRAVDVNVRTLPLIAREKLPSAFRGKFTAQLWSEWEQARPVSVRGKVRVRDLKLPLPGWDSPLGIHEAGGDLTWQARRSGWRLDVANLRIGLTGPAWAAEHLRVAYQPEESRIQIGHLNLGDITGFIARVKSDMPDGTVNSSAKPNKLVEYLLASQPAGAIDNLDVRLQGDWQAPEDFSLAADIGDGTVMPYEKYPGVRGLSGHLTLSRRAGNLLIDSKNVTVSLPRVFRASLVAERASGDLRWEKSNDDWLIDGNDLRVVSADARGNGKLTVRVPLDKSVSPQLKLRVDFHDGNGAHAARYFPVHHLSPATLAWMERSFVAGEITRGYLIYDGPIHDFPFRNNTGKFELRGHVRRAVYQFLPGWEPIKQGEVDVAVNNTEVLVTGRGKIGNLNADQVVVQSRVTDDGHRIVRVSGQISGPVNETLNVLRAAKPEPGTMRWLAYVPSDLQGSGAGSLSLDLTIPLGEKHSLGLNGEYRFLKSSLFFSGKTMAAEAMEGGVRFTQAGIREGTLHARFLGGETVLAASQNNGLLLIHGQGAITSQGIAPWVGPRIAPYISGIADWTGTWRWSANGANDLRAEANLQGLKVSLPPPLDRPDGLAKAKLVVRTESRARDNVLLALNVDKSMSGKLALARDAGGWRLTSGRIGFGAEHVPTPREPGLHVSARVDAVDLDKWWPLLGGGPTGVPKWLNRVSAEVRSLDMFDRHFGSLSAKFYRSHDTWSGSINGASMAGNVRYSGKGPTARFELNLARLVLPDKQHDRRAVEVDPGRLPTVELRSKFFQYRDKPLGELDFMAMPGDSGWRIKRFNLARPDMKFNSSGLWRYADGRHESVFDMEFNSSDLGKTMVALGVPDQVAGGVVSVKSRLSWPGSPANPQVATLSGGIEVSAAKGRFLQVSRGAGGRLFGLLDLSAISRYLKFDFSPVFGKGFIYDRIHGNVSVEKGNAYTHNFSIRGPATQLDVDGRVGLTAEDYDLTIELQPKLSDSLTLATWGVWGPQVAAVMLAVQKIFKKQIARGTRITYMVKGPWDNPAITKLEKGAGEKTSAVPVKPGDGAAVR